MKKLIVMSLSLMLIVGVGGLAVAGSLDSPGAPSAGSGMYTLQNLYDYLTSGTALTVQSSFQEPTSGPGSTMKTTRQIGDDVKALLDLCATTTAANVESGKAFFCTQPGSWGVQTGTAIVITATPTSTPTATATPIYASCKAIRTAIPTANDGLYTIDPDGPGGNAPFSAYCDMTSDGGGWTLVVRVLNDSEHLNAGAVGELTSPTQGTSAKLADSVINTLSTDYYRFTCNSYTSYFDAVDKPFDANSTGDAAIMKVKCSSLNDSWSYSTGDYRVSGFVSYPCSTALQYGVTVRSGCYSVPGMDWGATGMVYTR